MGEIIVSVIIPLYHGEKYIKRQLDQCQKALNYAGLKEKAEIIFVVDRPGERYTLQESNLRFIYHETNEGIHKSRVDGLNVARGVWIHFLDQDDLICRSFYQILLEIAGKDTHVDVCVGNGRNPNPNILNRIIYINRFRRTLVEWGISYYFLNNRIISPGQCLVYKKSIPEYWKENIMQNNSLDDYFLWLLMFSMKRKFVTSKHVVFCHRYTGVNLSSDPEKINRSAKEMERLYNSCPYAKYKKQLSLMVRQIVGEKGSENFFMRMVARMIQFRNALVDKKAFVAARDL